MPVELPELTKRYYTPGEVSAFVGVRKGTIMYWEKKFPMLHVQKFGNGERRFTADQVRLVHQIHHLLREKGFTIPGALKELTENRHWFREKPKMIERLKTLRRNLEDLKLEL
jgi:DNA-binding transcriptional MerR regulator